MCHCQNMFQQTMNKRSMTCDSCHHAHGHCDQTQRVWIPLSYIFNTRVTLRKSALVVIFFRIYRGISGTLEIDPLACEKV